MACSGIHREFSARVKGIGASSFTADEVARMRRPDAGNEAVNAAYLARYSPTGERLRAPTDNADQQLLRVWIRRKYVDRAWHQPGGGAAGAGGAGGGGGQQQPTQPTRVKIPDKKKRPSPAPGPAAPPSDLLGFSAAPAPAAPAAPAPSSWDAFGGSGGGGGGGGATFDAFGGGQPQQSQQQPQPAAAFQANFDQMPAQQPLSAAAAAAAAAAGRL